PTSIGAACGGNDDLHLPHLPVSARWRTGMRLIALHSEHTRRMRKCYGAPVAKTKGKSRKGKAATKSAPKAARAPVNPALEPRTARTKARAVAPAVVIPMPPPPPPPPRDELPAPRDVARLTRYGERFGPYKIDVRFLQNVQLPVSSGAIGLFDPGAPKSWRV